LRSAEIFGCGGGEPLQCLLLDLDEVRPHLASRRAVNAQPGDGAIPVAQKRIVGIEAVEASILERIAFYVPPLRSCLPFSWACAAASAAT
jgi:hypothetical protein